MDLDDPVPGISVRVRISHPGRIGGADAVMVLIALDAGVREFAHQMTGDLAAEQPAGLDGLADRLVIELGAGDIGVPMEMIGQRVEDGLEIGAEFVLPRIVADHIGAADIGLPLFEDRSEVEKDDVILLHLPDRRVLRKDGDGVQARAHDALMPMHRDAEILFGQSENVAFDVALASSRRDQAFGLDRVEHGFGLFFGLQQGGELQIIVHGGLFNRKEGRLPATFFGRVFASFPGQFTLKEAIMTRDDVTQLVLTAKRKSGKSWKELAASINPEISPIVLTAALLGQMTLTAEEAKKAVELLDLPADAALLLTEIPYRGSIPAMPPTDPLIYRFYELVMVYGTTFKELIQEEFGDGIMSAIDFDMTMERQPDPKGDRVKLVMSGKFLSYKRY